MMKFSVLIMIIASGALAASDPSNGCNLIKALKFENEAKAIRLLEEGANATYVDHNGRLPMHLAALYGYEKVFHFLMENGYKYQIHEKDNFNAGIPLMTAVRGEQHRMADLLIQSGSDVNTEEMTNVGWNPLRMAAKDGDVKMIELLLENGADLYSTNDFGFTALELAELNNHSSAVYILQEAERKSVARKKELPKNSCNF
ncbi:60 kDa lysophospholipase-like [Sitodiplosis mosellana]|uniref:60 kDa lysophospholipase-like n=1 Tax=Sitodiplosis mosellana TaxID=263140 RepID=UPI002443BEE9|nr:60 kDa lysophospholipase-like [Sitodiplosis mosellana]XP_055308253.1 60 kDa lysophospholipase-like [Sitodiplosis mosellana]XP_055308254.1 60 kDa lysophospholipase-like [Sitodiplosis mosellana]